MSVKIGSTDITDIRLGSTPITAVYLGGDVIWPTGTPSYLAQYKFDLGTVSNITATVGPDLVATGGDYPVGGMSGGSLYNGYSFSYTSYANYPLLLSGVTKITILGFAGQTNGGVLFIGSTNGQRIIGRSDGSVYYTDYTIGDTDMVPAGTVPFDGSKADVVLILPNPINLIKFCGGGGVWQGSMDELIIE